MSQYDKFSTSSPRRYTTNFTPQKSNYVGVAPNSKNIPLSTPRFRRYFLAEARATSTPESKKISENTRISTSIDSQSPGLCSRVVEYYKEQEHSTPSLQSHYNKLGNFPIVHFFKKEVPVLKRKNSESNDVSSLELSKFNSPEQNRMLLEKIIKSSPGNQCSVIKKNEANPKSVLEALKEISRKRINPNEEEFILREDGKRVHGNYEGDVNNRKRMKQNSGSDDSIFNFSSPKMGFINELMASHSSMDGCLSERTSNKGVNVQIKSLKKQSPVKPTTASVQTQTPVQSPQPVEPEDKDCPVEEKPNEDTTPSARKKKSSPVKIFDETPLENIRKSRLTILVGSPDITKQKQQPENPPNDTKSPVGKPLVSILSGASKSPSKSTKHVTFNIPEVSSVSESSFVPLSSMAATPPGQAITKTSTSVISPIVSASESKILGVSNTIIPTSTQIGPVTSKSELSGGFKFELKEPSSAGSFFVTTSAPSVSVPTVTQATSSSFVIPNFANSTSTTSFSTTPFTQANFTSKFTSPSLVTSPSNSFNTTAFNMPSSLNFTPQATVNSTVTPQTTVNSTVTPQTTVNGTPFIIDKAKSSSSSSFTTGFTTPSIPLFPTTTTMCTSTFLSKPVTTQNSFSTSNNFSISSAAPSFSTPPTFSFTSPQTSTTSSQSSGFTFNLTDTNKNSFAPKPFSSFNTAPTPTPPPSTSIFGPAPSTTSSFGPSKDVFTFNKSDKPPPFSFGPSKAPSATFNFQSGTNNNPFATNSNSFAPRGGNTSNSFSTQAGANSNSFAPQNSLSAKSFAPQGGANSNTFAPQSGLSSNSFSTQGGASSNTFAPQSGLSGNSFASQGVASNNSFAPQSGLSGNSFASQGAASSNSFAPQSGLSSNIFAQSGFSSGSFAPQGGINTNSFTPQPAINSNSFGPQGGAGMFSIGAGGSSTPNRSRLMHKTKRRT